MFPSTLVILFDFFIYVHKLSFTEPRFLRNLT